jgi:hypothetical protein
MAFLERYNDPIFSNKNGLFRGGRFGLAGQPKGRRAAGAAISAPVPG